MATTLVDDLNGLFRSQALGEAAANLHESESSVMRGFQTASAAILGGLVGKAGESGFIRQVYDLITNSFGDGKTIESLSGLFRPGGTLSESTGNRFLSMLFGSNQGTVEEKISQSSGLRPESASKLLSFAAPVVLGLLGKRAQESHLDASGLSSLLQREGAGLSGLLPAGLSSVLGWPSASAAATAAGAHSRPSSNRWLWPVLLLLALLGILWMWTRSRTTVSEVATSTTNAVASTASRLGDMVRTTLANGVELNIPSMGLENNLLTFLRNPVGGVDPNRWFEFDRLTFDTNAATLQPESREQLSNLAAILKAYPNAKVKIGGYTDNTGDPAANLSLSQRRADSVRDELVAMGIARDRLESEGYGSEHAVADNATEEGRAKNRRIALRVTAL